jgi:hypothetical protein
VRGDIEAAAAAATSAKGASEGKTRQQELRHYTNMGCSLPPGECISSFPSPPLVVYAAATAAAAVALTRP